MNSGLAQDQARAIAERLHKINDNPVSDGAFANAAFETVLARRPTKSERNRCQRFLAEHQEILAISSQRFTAGGSTKRAPASDTLMRARENLIHVLLLHNDFVTIR